MVGTAWIFALTLLQQNQPRPGEPHHFELKIHERVLLSGVPFRLTISCVDRDGYVVRAFSEEAKLEGLASASGEPIGVARFVSGVCEIPAVLHTQNRIYCTGLKIGGSAHVFSIWAPFAIFPVILVVVLAMMTRQILIALAAGVWMGALFLNGFNPVVAILRVLDEHLVQAFGQTDHALILAFLIGVGGTIGIVTHNGGLAALVERLSVLLKNRRNTMIATWLAGLGVFFDAAANSVTVGNAMRPLSDQAKVSREKFAFILDGTAASMATLALMSTWIGYLLLQLEDAGTLVSGTSSYEFILSSLPFGFYAILMIAFVFALAASQRDFGPMARAETRALSLNQLFRPDSHPMVDADLAAVGPTRWINAVVPLASLVIFVIAGLILSGLASPNLPKDATFGQIIGRSSGTSALLWAAGGATLVGIILSSLTGAMTPAESIRAWAKGARAMALPCIVLTMAWAMGQVCQDLGTGRFLSSFLGPIDPRFVPAMIFMISCLVAFAMGNTYVTVAIVTSVALPMLMRSTSEATLDAWLVHQIRFASVGAILSGSILGNHLSLVSDTTIVAAAGAGCDHIDHVHTQLPYAAFVGLASLVVGYLPAGFGLHPAISYAGGAVAILTVIFIICDKTQANGSTSTAKAATAQIQVPTSSERHNME